MLKSHQPTRFITLLLVFLAATSFGATALAKTFQTETTYVGRFFFPLTGHSVENKFLQYWHLHGGIAIFGMPTTAEFYENGRLVQYFERNRFELHPELAGTAYEVQLGLLGSEQVVQQKLSWPKSTSSAKGVFFQETGYNLEEAFLDYWNSHGGLTQFGYPISPTHDEAGRLTQYFERAKFQLFPEHKNTTYYVQLGLIAFGRVEKLDISLRDTWVEKPIEVNIQVNAPNAPVPPLTPLTITSDKSGDLRLLGGDNRHYAVYKITAGVPLTIYVAGMSGKQGLLLYQEGKIIASRWNAFEVSRNEPGIKTGDLVWDSLYGRVKGFLEKDVVIYDSPQDGKPVLGYRSPDTPFIWLRDHVYQSKCFKYFEPDMKAALDYFRGTQRPDGSFDDYFQYHNGYDVYKGQIEIEADREYLFVEGVWTAWQATEDDSWLRQNIEAMERGLEHTYSDPRRWSKEYGLVKRAFTIDTWDFEQGSDKGNVRRTFDDKTRWSIMHGDNTGLYAASRRLAAIESYFGRQEQANFWDKRADELLIKINQHLWNGSFYVHQLHLTPTDPTNVDEAKQLSLSNAYALNRGTLSQSQAAALLQTYQARRNSSSFAEWYSIDPAFPNGFGPVGEYVNGGIMPLVGGELARGAFEYGYESYGVDILKRYWQLLEKTGGSYLWYHPDGRPGIGTDATLPTDGWGSAAMLNALLEGLAGVSDQSRAYQSVKLAPRWAATDRSQAQVTLEYGASKAYFTYQWQQEGGKINLVWGGSSTQAVQLHLLLPNELNKPEQMLVNGLNTPFKLVNIGNSVYLEANLPASGKLEIR